jgi:hypothetical protein
MLKHSIPGIFQLAAARVAPALRFIDQWPAPLIDAGASRPGRAAPNKMARP